MKYYIIICGGGWNYYSNCCQISGHGYNSPGPCFNGLGFRLTKKLKS